MRHLAPNCATCFQHVLGRDVETVDMFRLGRYNSDKVRPIAVRLRS